MGYEQSMLRTGSKETIITIDQETGEVLDENIKHHRYIANSKEQFMMLYVAALPIFIKISHPAKSVYAYMLGTYNNDTVFGMEGHVRSYVAKNLGISNSAVANALTELKREKLIFSPNKGLYQLNPRYAFKGGSAARNKALKAVIELGCEDC